LDTIKAYMNIPLAVLKATWQRGDGATLAHPLVSKAIRVIREVEI
jgi:hypothetical protein